MPEMRKKTHQAGLQLVKVIFIPGMNAIRNGNIFIYF